MMEQTDLTLQITKPTSNSRFLS